MNTRVSAGIGLAIGVLITAIYYQFAHPAVPPLQVPPDCPPPAANSEKAETECVPATLPEKVYSHELLPPPKYRAGEPATYATNREGEAHVVWTGVKGAKAYRVFLEDDHGKVVKTYSTSRTSLYLKDIPMPEDNEEAKLHVRLASLNGDDKLGTKGEARVLQLSRQAQVVAPTVKKITVED